MQTFLPYKCYQDTAKTLDYRRLGKQRVEVLQLLKALAGETKGWRNHPAAKMWIGSERHLINYGLFICEEWINRGYNDTCRDKIDFYWKQFPKGYHVPEWIDDERLYESHRSNLLRKDFNYYSQFGWKESNNLPYFWPV